MGVAEIMSNNRFYRLYCTCAKRCGVVGRGQRCFPTKVIPLLDVVNRNLQYFDDLESTFLPAAEIRCTNNGFHHIGNRLEGNQRVSREGQDIATLSPNHWVALSSRDFLVARVEGEFTSLSQLMQAAESSMRTRPEATLFSSPTVPCSVAFEPGKGLVVKFGGCQCL